LLNYSEIDNSQISKQNELLFLQTSAVGNDNSWTGGLDGESSNCANDGGNTHSRMPDQSDHAIFVVRKYLVAEHIPKIEKI